MAVLVMLLRAVVRYRWRSWLLLSLLAALVSGFVLAGAPTAPLRRNPSLPAKTLGTSEGAKHACEMSEDAQAVLALARWQPEDAMVQKPCPHTDYES